LAAKTIADIYQERGQIEIFFRFIKQNLKIKAFIGNSENAVLTQIYAALLIYLLLCYLKFMCNLRTTLQNCIRILQLNLFRTCTRQEFFHPLETIPVNICNSKQLTLALV
jgi:IS4 transposase